MNYYSFVGNHDAVVSNSNEHGAFFNIYKYYCKEIKQIFVFVTKSNSKIDYNKIAKENIELIKEINNKVNIHIIALDLPNPVDFDLVYPSMLDKLLSISKEYKIQKESKIINITSGTPTMTSCWVLIGKSGLIGEVKLIQSFETRFAKDGRTVQEANLDIDDFPKISIPKALKRQLTILSRNNRELKDQLEIESLNKEIPNLIGNSKQILEIKDQIINDVNSDTHVLILGERGTGKEVIANAIWSRYHKENDQSLNVFDCSTITTEMAVSELFGHVRGAFTGASEDKKGILEANKGKMIFLDEIGNLSKTAQSNFLRVLTHGEYRKLGSERISRTDSQIIAATNKNVDDQELFAQDIKDRFDEIIILPPLRERAGDIPLLIQHFIGIYSKLQNIPTAVYLDDKITHTMAEYSWPGNIRDLEKFIQRLLRRFNNGGKISYNDLPSKFINDILDDESLDLVLPSLPLPVSLQEYTHHIIEKARSIAKSHSEVDKLLKQKDGAERQRRHNRNKA